MSALLVGADTIDARLVPDGLDWYAGYVGGHWPTWSPLAERFPELTKHGRIVPIAVNASEHARVLDVEIGDATPPEAGPWCKRMIADGVKLPGIYASLSMMPGVIASIRAVGLKPGTDVVLWAAHWDGIADVPDGFQAKQLMDHGPHGENYDQNRAVAAFFVEGHADHVNAAHYEWFRPFQRRTVKTYDRLRKNPKRHRAELAVCRRMLRRHADGAWRYAHQHPRRNGQPNWGDHRGWRYQQLVHRSHGQRFV